MWHVKWRTHAIPWRWCQQYQNTRTCLDRRSSTGVKSSTLWKNGSTTVRWSLCVQRQLCESRGVTVSRASVLSTAYVRPWSGRGLLQFHRCRKFGLTWHYQASGRRQKIVVVSLWQLSSNSTWLDSTQLDSTRHIRRVEPMHFGCVELVEQHSSTRSTRRARLARLARHVELDRRYLQLSYDHRNSFIV